MKLTAPLNFAYVDSGGQETQEASTLIKKVQATKD